MAYIVAAHHRRYHEMPVHLKAKTGEDFALVSDLSELQPDKIAGLDPRYIFLVHWSHRVPASVYGQWESVIFHMTDVPFGRGGSPLQNLIARGIYETKISALRCEEAMDAGPVYLKRDLSLTGRAEEIYCRAASIIEDMIFEIVKHHPFPTQQAGEPVIFKRRRAQDGDLSSLTEIRKIYDYIRMLDADGYPPAFIQTDGMRFEFSNASLDDDHVVANVKISRRKSEA